MKGLTIGEVTEQAGVHIETLLKGPGTPISMLFKAWP